MWEGVSRSPSEHQLQDPLQGSSSPSEGAPLQVLCLTYLPSNFTDGRTVSDGGIRCRICSRVFRGPHSQPHYRLHYDTVHLKIRKHKCGVCGKCFSQNGSRNRHQKSCEAKQLGLQLTWGAGDDPGIPDGYRCAVCQKAFLGPYAMPHFILHFRTVHLKIRKHECATCGRRFSQIGSKKRHQQLCVLPKLAVNTDGTAVCLFCYRGFKTKAAAKRHEFQCSMRPSGKQ
ncbi:hypothetical protein ACHWQZ_G005926 [Mnemiopsis leidyi]